MQAYFNGLGFIQGWLWIFMLNGPLLYKIAGGWGDSAEKIFIAFLFFHSTSFLLIGGAHKRVQSVRNRPIILGLGATLTLIGYILLAFTRQAGFLPAVGIILFATAALGFGAALIVLAWGEFFSTLSVKKAGKSYAGAVTLGTLLFYSFGYLGDGAAQLAVGLLPVLSVLFLFLIPRSSAIPIVEHTESPAGPVLPTKLVLLIVFFYLAGGFMYKLISPGNNLPALEAYWLTGIVYCLVTIAAGVSFYFRPFLTFHMLYRPVLPLLGAGFVLIPLLSNVFGVLPFTLFQAGFALFDTYTWILFASLAARHRSPLKVFGWGMFLITFSILVGEVLFTMIFASLELAAKEMDLGSLLAALMLFGATMLFHDHRKKLTHSDPGSEEKYGPWLVGHQQAAATLQYEAPIPETGAPRSLRSPQQILTDEDMMEKFSQSHKLTKQEQDIVLMLLKGRNNPYITEQLNISNNTLKTHLRNIYRKLSVNNRQELITMFGQYSDLIQG